MTERGDLRTWISGYGEVCFHIAPNERGNLRFQAREWIPIDVPYISLFNNVTWSLFAHVQDEATADIGRESVDKGLQ